MNVTCVTTTQTRITAIAAAISAYREISALEKSPARAPIFRRYRAFYPWAAGAALVLLLLAHALDRTVWRAAV